MPVYNVRAPDGNTYQVRGPEGASREEVIQQVIARYPDAARPVPRGAGPRPIQEENLLEQIPLVGTPLAGLADLVLGLNIGTGNVMRTVADVAGAGNPVSDAIETRVNQLRGLRSSGARRDAQLAGEEMQRAEGTGVLNEIAAAGRAFTYNPLDTLAEGVGSAAPFAAAAFAGGPYAAVGLGALSGAGNIKGTVYDAVKAQALADRKTEAEAEALAQRAQEYAGEHWFQILLGGGLGAIAGRFGVEASAASIATRRAMGLITAEEAETLAQRAVAAKAAQEAAESATLRSVAGGTARGFVGEGLPEAAQAAQERYAANQARINEGADIDPWAGVAGQATLEGLMGGLLGGPMGGVETSGHNQSVRNLQAERAVVGQINPEIDEFVAQAADGDEAAKARVVQNLVDLLGYDEDMAEARANSYVQLEINRRKEREAEATPAAPETQGEGEVGGAPAPSVAPSPAPAAPEAATPREAPIVRYRREAADIEGRLPPPEEGMVRLWRGNRPGENGVATRFTNDLPGIALPFAEGYGGDVTFVDVPVALAPSYLNTGGASAEGAEFNLPAEVAARAVAITDITPEPVESEASVEDEVRRVQLLLNNDDYIAGVANRRGMSEDEVVTELQDQLAGLESQLPPVQSEYTPREQGAELAAQALEGQVPAVDVGALSPEAKQAYADAMMEAEFGPTEFSEPTTNANIPVEENVVSVEDTLREPQGALEDSLAVEQPTLDERQALTEQSEPVFAPEESAEPSTEFLPGELFAEEAPQANEPVDEAAIIDTLIAEQQALFDAEPVKSTPRAKKAQRAIRQLQDAKEGLALELPLAEGLPEATPEQVEAAQESLAQQRALSGAKQVEREAQAVKEAQAMVQGLGPNYAMYEFRHLPDAPQGKFEVWVKRRDGRTQRRSVHKTLKAFLNAVDDLKGITDQAEQIESDIKTGAGLDEDGYKNTRTVAHKAVQDLTAEIERQSAEGKKKLSNLQRTELLRMLENPVKRYDEGERKGQVRHFYDEAGNAIPYTQTEKLIDAKFRKVEKRMKVVRDIEAKINASGTKSKTQLAALRKGLEEANSALLDAVNEITTPVRARMQEMIEDRENEQFGAKQIAEQLAVEEKLGFADLAEMRETVESLRPGYDAYLKTEADIAAAAKGRTPLEAEAATKGLQAKLRRLKPKYDEYLKARAFLDEQMNNLAEVRAERRRAEQDFNEARVFKSLVTPENTPLVLKEAVKRKIALGPEEIDAMLKKAVADGDLSKEGAELTRWFISKNSAIANDLYVALAETSLTEDAAGAYDVDLQYIKIIPQCLTLDPLIGVHEILHHTERMLPEKLQKAIFELWQRDVGAFREVAEGDERAYMDAIVAAHNSDTQEDYRENIEYAKAFITSGAVSKSLYRYLTSSEYWAEMGSEIMAQRFAAKDSTLAKIKQWYREFLEKLKELFGKPSAAPVLRALDNILNGDGSFVNDSMLFSRDGETAFNAPKIPLKQQKKFRESGEKISEGLRKAQLTQSTYTVAEETFGTIKHRLASKDVFGYLKDVWNRTDARTLGTFLTTLPTSGIVGWMQDRLPGLQAIVDRINEMQAMKRNLLAASEKIAKEIQQFTQKQGDETLAETMITARINQVKLGEFASIADALQRDPVLVEIRKQLTQNPSDTQKKARLQKAETTRETQLRDSYALWDALGKQEGGQQLYLKLRNYYKTSYIAMRAAQDKVISEFPDAEAAKNLLAITRRQQEEAMVRDESDVFADLPPDLFHKDYFPFSRFGKYYLRVAAYKGTSRQLYTFDTPGERDAALRAVSEKLGVSPDSDTGRRIFEKGDDIADLQEEFNTDDEMMRRVLEELKKAEARTSAIGPTEIKQMKDAIYQVYLMSAPERSLRRSFLKAEDVIGMSTDVLRTFSTRASSMANQLARAEYGNAVRMATEAAYDNIDPTKERDLDERRRLQTVVREISNRAEAELDPEETSWWANALNRLAYLYFLTAPATAAVQFTSIPIRVVPHLGARYGYGKTTKVWAKYMKLWETVGSGEGATPDVLSSKVVKSNPLLAKALRTGLRRGVLETLGQTLVNNEAQEAGSSKGKFREYSAKLHNLMTYMFTASENISKQAAYLMAFELEHEKLMAAEKPTTESGKQDVFDRAVSSALEAVSDTIGDYSSIERPSIMSGNIGRMLFLFKAYSVAQTKWFLGTARRMLGGGNFTAEERWTAWKDMIGVNLMAYMFAGTVGLPLYSVVAAAMKAIVTSLEDDDEERERRMRNPYTADDYDLWFRYEWLPSVFGEATIFGRPISAVMANGPISELTDVNLTSRTGMDLKQMWWRDSPEGSTALGTLGNMLLANIAAGGMATNFDKAFTKISEGDWQRGLELLAPALPRNLFASVRLGQEGITTNSDKTVMAPEEFSAFNLIMQSLGFQSMTASKVQQMRVKIESFDAATAKERTDLMDTYADAVRAGADDETVREAAEDIMRFNDRYPLPEYQISIQDLQRSLRTRERQRDVRGVTVTKKEEATKERAFAQIR